MDFENIAVSKNIPNTNNLKYLACAECDKDPLGWTCSKVSYLIK